MPYQVTGNEYISLPMIREDDGIIEGVTFLYMRLKGLLELRGDDGLIRPYLCVNGERATLAPRWSREHSWIPSFSASAKGVDFSCVYLTPVGERAFAIRLAAVNNGAHTAEVRIGTDGRWDRTLHEINETTELTDGRGVERSGWNHMFVWTQKPGVPLFAFAPCVGDNQPFSEIDQGAEWSQEGFSFDINKSSTLAPSEGITLDVFFGVGYEVVAAATGAKELLRQGFEALYKRTAEWLAAREKHVPDMAMQEVLNTNLFFSFFYASGRTIDTEELCLMTSRSPRYYVSAAYWDRDSLLWAFPAILETDKAYAREILCYVFTKQARNLGTHSRYIDGTVLEPGFELDELCAPVIALERYVRATGDMDFAKKPFVLDALQSVLDKLASKKHKQIDLYETFLMPTDDLRRYPYLTYDNALVWYVLRALATFLERPELNDRAQRVRDAVYKHCTREEDGKRSFVWSVDLNGNSDIYDEPPGSLLLLPFYGFCNITDDVWCNTAAIIRSDDYALSFAGKPIAEIGCAHAPHPWVLSVCNSLLGGLGESAIAHLRKTKLDNGIACESVNEDTGVCETGEAFATCAGFLAYALIRYYKYSITENK